MASGKFNSVSKFGSAAPPTIEELNLIKNRSNLLPQDFNLNIAESQLSIDFDISESKGNYATQNSMPLNHSKGDLHPQRRSTLVDKKGKNEEHDES